MDVFLSYCQMCHTFGRGISWCYQFLLEEVRKIPENVLFALHVVKFWERLVQKSLSCDSIPIEMGMCFVLVFLFHCTLPPILYA